MNLLLLLLGQIIIGLSCGFLWMPKPSWLKILLFMVFWLLGWALVFVALGWDLVNAYN